MPTTSRQVLHLAAGKKPMAVSELGFHSPSGSLYCLFPSLPFLLKKKNRFSQIADLSDSVFSRLYLSKLAPDLLAYQKFGLILKSKKEMIVAQITAAEVKRSDSGYILRVKQDRFMAWIKAVTESKKSGILQSFWSKQLER